MLYNEKSGRFASYGTVLAKLVYVIGRSIYQSCGFLARW